MSLDNRHTEASIQRFVVPEIASRFLNDGLVAVFTLRSFSKPAINAFFDKVVSAYNSWPEEAPYTAVYNIEVPNLTLTPQALQQIDELLCNICDNYRHGAWVVVLNDKQLKVAIDHHLKHYASWQQDKLNYTSASSLEEALAWITARV